MISSSTCDFARVRTCTPTHNLTHDHKLHSITANRNPSHFEQSNTINWGATYAWSPAHCDDLARPEFKPADRAARPLCHQKTLAFVEDSKGNRAVESSLVGRSVHRGGWLARSYHELVSTHCSHGLGVEIHPTNEVVATVCNVQIPLMANNAFRCTKSSRCA